MENTEHPNTAQSNGSSPQYLTFGRYLKKVRVDRGISIEDIMDETRISKYVIQQIEAENLHNLPEDVYLKGFLKAYAEAVGIDPVNVLERYGIAKGLDENPHAHVKRDGQGTSSGSMAKLLVVCVIVLVAAATFAVYYMGNIKGIAKTHSVPETASESVEAAIETEPAPVIEEKAENPVPEGGLYLEVICVEETTLKITADGGLPEEYKLKPEEHLELKAEKMYNILIDNTCGVSMYLNSNPVSVPGKCGQTATIQLP